MTGLVLAGGRSRRFGSDKSRFILPGESRNMLQRTLALLGATPGVTRLAVSCRADQSDGVRASAPDVTIVEDIPHEISSPLYGVMAALEQLGGPLLVLSCDLPRLRADVLEALVRARNAAMETCSPQPSPLRTSFIHDNGRVETLISIYEGEALPFLKESLSAGRIGLFSAIPYERQRLIPCPDEDAFVNMNTVDDIQRNAQPR